MEEQYHYKTPSVWILKVVVLENDVDDTKTAFYGKVKSYLVFYTEYHANGRKGEGTIFAVHIDLYLRGDILI